MNKRTNLEKGITLIALIITIIVLLILAGVSIATLTGENGLLNKAVSAKDTTAQKTAEEQVKLAIMASYNAEGKIDLGQLKENLNNIEGITKITEDITDASFPLSVTINGQEVQINKSGNTMTAVATTTPSEPEEETPNTPDEEETPTEIAITKIQASNVTVEKGETANINVTKTPSDTTEGVTYTSANATIATVDANGVVTGVSSGTTIITIAGEKTTSVSTEIIVTVTEPVGSTMYNAKEAMPEGASIKEGTTEETGIVMVDSNENEWVWIEVPEEVFTTATSKTDYYNIKTDLISYATDYRASSYSDTYYSGCGVSSSTEYTTLYQKMLSSVYENKGFYITRYEAGDATATASNTTRTEDTGGANQVVSKVDQIPYNYVTCSQAQKLASSMATGDKTSSLMFGIQWDLVCKYLEESGTSTNSMCKSWGNYCESSLTLSRGKYNTNPKSALSTWKAYNEDTTNYVTNSVTSSNSSYYQLLTTGASEQTNKMNIYDFAGNEREWTLEEATWTSSSCVHRGGCYNNLSFGQSFPASGRDECSTTGIYDTIGFRSTLY